ncbi:MAG: MauE/DoxX family redox-associated membrane protein [Chlamydiota bacterium]
MDEKKSIKDYWPLIVLLLVTFLAATALTYGQKKSSYQGMHFFMGLFFCIFAMFKLFNLAGFVTGFRLYDLLAKKVAAYGYFYPFIELALGLAYLSFICPILTYSITVILMVLGSIGVIQSLKNGLDTRCVCMGTVLNVPLSTVTLIEDVGMGVMAFIMLMAFF